MISSGSSKLFTGRGGSGLELAAVHKWESCGLGPRPRDAGGLLVPDIFGFISLVKNQIKADFSQGGNAQNTAFLINVWGISMLPSHPC